MDYLFHSFTFYILQNYINSIHLQLIFIIIDIFNF